MSSAEADLAQPRFIRSGVIAVFGLLGPAIGTAAVLALFVGESMLRPASGDPFAFRQALPAAIALGYLFGMGPAFTAGLIYAFVPRLARRIALAPVYGAIAVWLSYALLPVRFERGLTDNWLLLSAGAVAAVGCAILVRRLGIDGMGTRA